jgi:hypothetical protein
VCSLGGWGAAVGSGRPRAAESAVESGLQR